MIEISFVAKPVEPAGYAGAASEVIGKTQSFSVQHFIEHLFPKSVFEALATNEILQIVVFSIFFGVALTQYGEKGDSIVKFLDNLSKVILIVVGYVMWFAPLGVFGGITAIIATKGLGILNRPRNDAGKIVERRSRQM